MKQIFKFSFPLTLILLCFVGKSSAQYNFEIIHQVDNTEIKNQGKTGTCWSFASISFLESELIRETGDHLDLSEMFIVRDVYKDKARNFILRQGKANFSEGALAHDMLNAAGRKGVVPESVYSGKKSDGHNHKALFKDLKVYLDSIVGKKEVPSNWEEQVDLLLDKHLEPIDDQFLIKEKQYSSKEYYKYLNLDVDKYVNVTSFSHHPFDQEIILEIPDNYSNGKYLNLEIEKLETLVDVAIENGHSVIWDGDVSEKGFSAKKGLAIYPEEFNERCFDKPCKEKLATQKDRQMDFESYVTTDDHLMHLVGIAKNEEGGKFYIIKNSWGEISDYNGYLMMSEAYFRSKTVAITINKEFLKAVEGE